MVSVVARSDFRPALTLIWVSPRKQMKVNTFRRICHHCMWLEAATKTLTSIQPASSKKIATGAKPGGSKEPEFLSTFSVAVLQFQRRCGREAGTYAYISLLKLCPISSWEELQPLSPWQGIPGEMSCLSAPKAKSCFYNLSSSTRWRCFCITI